MKYVPWVLVGLLLLWAVIRGQDTDQAVDRALAAEAAVATLRPLADSLRLEAERRDTLILTITDSVRVVVTRERIVQVASVDTIRAHTDSVGSVALDSLLASEAREDVAQDRLQAETLAWGGSWKALAEVNQAGWTQERIRGDLWEAAARSQRRRAWYERGAALLAIGVLVLR